MTYGFERYNGTSGLVVSFQNNTIRYTSSSGAAIKVTSATVEIVNNTITNNSSHGIWNKDNGSPDIHDNNINTNSKNRIYVEQSSPTNIKWNNIQGNGLCGIILLSTCSATYFSTLMQNKWNNIYNNTKYELSSLKTAHFMAENQFWNLFQYPPIDNQVNGDVDFSPWKTTANPDAGPGGSIGKLLAEERTSSEEVIVPTEFSLGANFPNPFNPETIIPYALPGDAQVTIKIFNLLGEEVAVLFDRHQTAGFHRILWTGKNDSGTIVASGIYCYRLEAQATAGDNFFAIRKMILLR